MIIFQYLVGEEDYIKDDAEEIDDRPYTDMDDSDDEDYIHIYYRRL